MFSIELLLLLYGIKISQWLSTSKDSDGTEASKIDYHRFVVGNIGGKRIVWSWENY